jgi:hypothetical protein
MERTILGFKPIRFLVVLDMTFKMKRSYEFKL